MARAAATSWRGAAHAALAYEKSVLTRDGAVARGDGSVEWMNTVKFNELINAGAPAK